jgi:hypothetical protein
LRPHAIPRRHRRPPAASRPLRQRRVCSPTLAALARRGASQGLSNAPASGSTVVPCAHGIPSKSAPPCRSTRPVATRSCNRRSSPWQSAVSRRPDPQPRSGAPGVLVR